MSPNFKKLIALLEELFQLNQPALDFGLYRIMHAKRAEISNFLTNGLPKIVQETLQEYRTQDQLAFEARISEVELLRQELRVREKSSRNIDRLRERINTLEQVDKIERDVYDHLYKFFKRYYSDGDFVAKRVYKSDTYAIPYQGEEIALHWANKDQYYIKSSEYLRDYCFRLKPDDEGNPMRVHFRLSDATESEHNNNKTPNGSERIFILISNENFIDIEDGEDGKELIIRFEHRRATLNDWPESQQSGKKKPPNQPDSILHTCQRIMSITNEDFTHWIEELEKPHVIKNGDLANYNRLESHLRRYTSRNTFDFFIHKDLAAFLNQELDFYIKNEVMHLDDLCNQHVTRVEQFFSKAKGIRTIGQKIITFLAQLENFQKKLWLKKKFVTETNYCIAVGSIPKEFYPEIVENKAQCEEWVKLCAIDQINGDLVTPGYSKQVTPEFLETYPTLMIDTQHFSLDFKFNVLESIRDIDQVTDAVLFHSENFQALSLMLASYKQQVKCIYIDPPFNTSEASLLYKNEYRHSTWMALIHQGLELSKNLLSEESVLSAAIDDLENNNLSQLLESTFGNDACLGTLIVETKPSGRTNDRFLATCHEYYHFYGLSGTTAQIRFLPLSEKANRTYTEVDDIGSYKWRDFLRTGGFSTPDERPNSFYPIYFVPTSGEIHLDWIPDAVEILPLDTNGKQRVWRKTSPSFLKHVLGGDIKIEQRSSGTWKVLIKDRVKDGTRPKSVWISSKYDAASHGTKLLHKLFGESTFVFPKALGATKDVLFVTLGDCLNGQILDYFAGSGTTGHAVINLNREDGGRRKFILVEMGDYFDTVLLPRLKKVTFTPEWKDGKPARYASPEEIKRSPRIFKVIRLESYEDTLNNLEINKTHQQQLALTDPIHSDGLREQYTLQYMLDVETRGSQSLLNIHNFADPQAYKLKVKIAGSDESREINVDLLETFNWLIGLSVNQIDRPKIFKALFLRDDEGRLRLDGDIKEDDEGFFWLRSVYGTMPDGRKALIIWRKLSGDLEQANLVLDRWFISHYLPKNEREIDVIWVNGGTNLEDLKESTDHWSVKLIEEDFHHLMFNGAGM